MPMRMQRIGEAHDAEPDLAVAARDRLDLRQRVVVHVDDVVEEAHAERDALAPAAAQSNPPVDDQLADVDRRQVARLERQQRQLAARVGRLHLAERRRRIDAR